MSEQPEQKVGDIMVPIRGYKKITLDCTIADAVKILYRSLSMRERNYGQRVLIVYDQNASPVGLVTWRAIFQALEPLYAKAQNLSIPVFWSGLFTQRCHAETTKNIQDIMHPFKFIALDANDPLIKAVHAMIKHKLGTLPVLDNNQFVGMVRAGEVFEQVHQAMVGVEYFEDASSL